MKVVAFNGSPRKNGNTAALIGHALAELEKEGIATETVQVGGKPVRGCLACCKCRSDELDKRCVIDDDVVNESIAKMLEADGIILGSPTYFSNVTAEMKALIDRAGYVTRPDSLLRRKVGAAVVAVRRAGALHVFNSINHFFLISQMIIPGSCYWNLGIGREKGEVENDAEGLETMRILGQNMAWLLKKLNEA